MKKRVLCMEDHTHTCKLIAAILRDYYYEVICTHSLEDAVQKASAEKFDLYLVDYFLSDGLGLEFILEVKRFNSETPILIVTGAPSLTESKAESLGARGIIKKDSPTFNNDLINQVSQLLE